jgi:hypothetical protein
MSIGEEDIAKLEQIMDAVEEFYFGDDENSGEQLFMKFASKHAHLFDDNCDAVETENKLEYTAVYQEFQETFEQQIEGNPRIFIIIG